MRVVVCGAGIAGVSTAYHLTRLGASVVLVDPLPPLSLTSDKSTECYRNWWPDAGMVGLMSRSIDLLEGWARESADRFSLNRRGYLYVTEDPDRFERMGQEAEAISSLGTGTVRSHTRASSYRPSPPGGFEGVPDGADLLPGGAALRAHFPWLSPGAAGALHVRRAGWLSAQQLGAYLLEQAAPTVRRRRLASLEVRGGGVSVVGLDDGSRLECDALVIAAGPMLGEVAALAGLRLPVHSEVHLKLAFSDHLEMMPRDAPMTIWADPQRIAWSEQEREALAAEGREDVLEELPPACHGRPEGGADSPWVLALWEYRRQVREPVWPIPTDPLYPEVVLRGMATMVPGLGSYRERLPRHFVDGGYYTKTRENRPLVGPCGPDGVFVCGALSGFGVMAAPAAGELAALHVLGRPLPDYAPAFLLARYDDPAYLSRLPEMEAGQL